MSINDLVNSSVEISKKFILTFWYSLTSPKKFFKTNFYDSIKLENKLFLMFSLLLFIVHYTNYTISFEEGSLIYNNIIDYTSINFLRTIILVFPIFIFFIFLIFIIGKLHKSKSSEIKNLSYYSISNMLIIKSLLYLSIPIINNTIIFLGKRNNATNIGISNYFSIIHKFFPFIAFAIPIYVIILISKKIKQKINIIYMIIILLSSNVDIIANNFLKYEFNIFGVKQIYEIKKIDFLSLDNFIFNVLDFKLIKNKSNDSINISANLLIQNKSNNLYLLDSHQLFQKRSPPYYYEELRDSIFFNFIMNQQYSLNNKDYLIIEPKENKVLRLNLKKLLNKDEKNLYNNLKTRIYKRRYGSLLGLTKSPYILTFLNDGNRLSVDFIKIDEVIINVEEK